MTVQMIDDRSNVRVVDILAFWYGRLGSNPEFVILPQVASDMPQMEPCTVYRGASRCDKLRLLITPNRY